MSEQDGRQAMVQQRPTTHDQDEWEAYWKAVGQPWRTEPEIEAERQQYLAERRRITPDIKQGMYPFTNIKLSRADVEWLLATHEDGRGPVDWDDVSQRQREGVDLRGADLQKVNLSSLPLAGMIGGLTGRTWFSASPEQGEMAAVRMQGALLMQAQLAGAKLNGASLERANLFRSHLEQVELWGASLKGAYLSETKLGGAILKGAHLEGADLDRACLEGVSTGPADLTWAIFDRTTVLRGITLGNAIHGYVRVADVNWGGANLTVVKWSQMGMLGDEQEARQRMHDGKLKDATTRLEELKTAVRANRQLANVLQAQALNEDAARFAYHAQKLQRIVLRRQRRFGAYLFSLFLDGVAGYGYRPQRCLLLYVLALLGFTLAHYIVGVVAGPSLTWLNALAVSVQSLHGRIFSFQSGDPQTLLNTIEAFVGLFIEAIVVAVITQRILGK